MPRPVQHDPEDVETTDELSTEHLDSQVQRAQEQLLSLKRQQDQIERQKRELEELSRRQDQLQTGRAEMVDRFTRAIVVLERETYDAQKRVELLQSIHEAFASHLQGLEEINPKGWEGLDITRELTKALSAVDDAKAEYNKSLPKISLENDSEAGELAMSGGSYHYDALDRGFSFWLKAGFAFTLPLFLLGLLVIILVSVLR